MVVLLSGKLWAQSTSINDIPMNKNTTISIKNGEEASKSDKQYEIVEGTGQIEGDPNLLAKDARASWKKTCDQWKKEIRDTNQDNKVMITDCGKVTCAPQGADGQVCHSEGSYKIKTKMN